MKFTPLGPWGVGASAGPATEGLKGLSGRVADPNPCDKRIRPFSFRVRGVGLTRAGALRPQPPGRGARFRGVECRFRTALRLRAPRPSPTAAAWSAPPPGARGGGGGPRRRGRGARCCLFATGRRTRARGAADDDRNRPLSNPETAQERAWRY